MPPRKRPGRSADDDAPRSDDSGQSGGRSGGESGGRGRLRRNPDADPVRLHRDYVQRRLGGGALPTPEAYERALDQWHHLGGAVRGPAQEVHRESEEEGARTAGSERTAAEEAGGTADRSYDGPLPATDPGDNSAYESGAS